MATLDAYAVRAQVWDGLDANIRKARSIVASASLDASVKAALNGALNADATRIDRLSYGGDLGMGVMYGSTSHEQWMNIARLTWDDIAAQVRYCGQSALSWSNVWDQVVVPTAETIKSGAGTALAIGVPALTLALAGGLALFLFVEFGR
jgi:hypothetical protein